MNGYRDSYSKGDGKLGPCPGVSNIFAGTGLVTKVQRRQAGLDLKDRQTHTRAILMAYQ